MFSTHILYKKTNVQRSTDVNNTIRHWLGRIEQWLKHANFKQTHELINMKNETGYTEKNPYAL